MIEVMKKVTVLAAARDREVTLERLRRVAVLHLEPHRPPRTDEMERLRGEAGELASALLLLGEDGVRGGWLPDGDGVRIARRLLDLDRQRKENEGLLAKHRSQLSLLERLGLEDPAELGSLASCGVNAQIRRLAPGDDTGSGRVLWRDDQGVWIVLFSTGAQMEGPGLRVELPTGSRTVLRNGIAALERSQSGLETAIRDLSVCREQILQAWRECRDAIALVEAERSLKVCEPLVAVAGYCPDRRLDELRRAARTHGWALRISDPCGDDPVPTLLSNGRLDRLFQPVMDFLGLTPGYREFHPNGVFLIFFTVFFAMIIGDAGYGLLMLLTTVGLGRWKPGIPRATLALSALLALATIGWGALTGAWFGVRALGESPILAWAVVPGLDAWREESRASVMRLCLGLGAGHLLVARLWAARVARGWRRIAELGWLGIVAGCALAAFKLLLGEGDWLWVTGALGLGTVLIVLGGGQRGDSFARGLWRGVVDLPLNLLTCVGTFSDSVSYLRLFAVGLATLEVAAAFNTMAAAIGWHSILSAIGASTVVLLGHSANLLLAGMGVLVHGVRLNLLEFSRHIGMSWAGVPYDPFRPTTPENPES